MKRLRVYLSSTFEDLKEYRRAVFDILEEAGLDVARMEAYTATDERPVDHCLRDVQQSDIYVGIYAWRYGYEPPADHDNPDGKSITELEYRQAERNNLRKLLFFAHPDTNAQWPDCFKDEVTGAGERGTKLNVFRQELGTEKMASFFRTPQELAGHVLASIMRSGLSGRPYNVPPRPPGFVQRSGLTTALVESLIGDGSAVPGVHTLVLGAGGFGKTTLAIDACQRSEVVKAFPGGMLWAALGEKPDLAQKLGDLHVAATGSPATVVGADAIGEMLVKALAGRPCLFVVDDAWRAEDLAPFLRLTGLRLLVTSRIQNLIEQTGETGWREISVDEMGPAEAAALLGRNLPVDDATGEALSELAERLGYWPLLLDLANARLLEEHKNRTGFAECIDRVTTIFERRGVLGFDRRDANARSTAVAKSVEVGLEFAEGMIAGLAGKAGELSSFPEDLPIPVRVLAELWAMDRFDVEEEAVRPMHNLSLLRWDRESDLVHLHDMIRRALGASLANVTEPSTVHRRLVDTWSDPYHLPHDYAWRWFGWHCIQAKEEPRLRRLLLDLDWLRAKIDATDINALVAEYEHVRSDPQAELLRGALRMSAHVLSRNKSEMAGQLLARIPEREKVLRKQILDRALTARGPWLRPLRPSLTQPGGPLLHTLAGHAGAVNAVSLAADGKRAVSGSDDRTLKVWDIESGLELQTLDGHADRVTAVAVTPDGRCVVSGSRDMTLKVWDVQSGRELRTLEGHTGIIAAVALTLDGKGAVSGSWDGTLKVWDVESGREVGGFQGHEDAVYAVALTPDGKRAISASEDTTLKVWDLKSGSELRTFEGHENPVYAVALTPDGKRAISGSEDTTLKVWDVESARDLRTLEGHAWCVEAVALTPDGKRAVSGSDDWTLKVWDVQSGRELRTLEGHGSLVFAIALTADGKRAVSGSDDGTLKVWDVQSGFQPCKPKGHAAAVNAIALTADGKRAVSASEDTTLKVWDVQSGRELRTLTDHVCSVLGVAISADGKCAVSCSFDRVLAWDIQRGYQLSSPHVSPINAVALTADGMHAVLGGIRTLEFWDMGSGRQPRTLDGHSITAVALSPYGNRAASCDPRNGLRVWDLERGCELRTLEGPVHRAGAVALTPDGKRAVSGSWDGTLKTWDVDAGRLVATFTADSGIRTCAVSSDGVTIAGIIATLS